MTRDRAAPTCPYCRKRPLETAATLPFVRGDGLGARFGALTIAGCKSCVRRKLLFETARSGLDGWASPAAVIANPVMLTYGLARAGAVRRDEARVRRMLEAAGLAEPARVDEPVRIAYGLAAAMIAADERVEREEIATAARIGAELFQDFDEGDFLAVVAARRDLPPPADLATVLKPVVNEATRHAVYRYLLAIAAADEDVAEEEHTVLRAVAENLGLSGPGTGIDYST